MDEEQEIIEKWKNVFGFEEYVFSEEMARTLALTMEEMALYMLTLPYNQTEQPILESSNDKIKTIMFPCIFRIIKGGGRIDSVPNLYLEVLQFFLQHNEAMWDISGVDMEAELCALFCEEYLKRGIEPITPRKFINPWVK